MFAVLLCLLAWGQIPAPGSPSVGGEMTEPELQSEPTAWTEEEHAQLARGLPIGRYWRDARGRARGLGAVLVAAPPERVWKHIVDIDAWVTFMPYVTASWVESWEEAPDHTRILAGYHLTTLGVTTRYRLDNRWYADRGLLVFDVIPEGKGPISAGDGWWRVTPWPDDPARVLLEYSVDMSMQWWVPGVLERKAADRLPTLVRLMKRQAEK